MMITLIKNMARNRVLQHILFWALSYYILLHVFSHSGKLDTVDYIYTAIFGLTLAGSVYLNLGLLLPSLLQGGRYLYFCIFFLVLLFISPAFNQYLFDYWIDWILPGYYFISYYKYFDLLKFFAAFLVVSSLLKLSKDWFYLNETQQKLTQIQQERTQMELQALRAQINPHFLFNSLNVLYASVVNNSKQSSELIIQLSDILRYVLYDSNKDFVPIESEIKLLEDYIAIQAHRVASSAQITFNKKYQKGVLIPPMLLLPLIENGYKHGIKAGVENPYLNIYLEGTERKLLFQVENSRSEIMANVKDGSGGIGLENIKNRLQIQYPNSHQFEIESSDLAYRVSLSP